MIQRHQSSRAALLSIREKLTSARTNRPEDVLNDVAAALSQARHYRWTGIYLAVEHLAVRQAFSGPAPASMGLSDLRSEIVVPIRLGVRTLGLIVAETGKASPAQERALLQQVAKLIAQYLTLSRSKQLLRKVREQGRSEASAERPHKSPQSAHPAARRAAAGERIPR